MARPLRWEQGEKGMRLDDLFLYWEETRNSLKIALLNADPELLTSSAGPAVGSVGDLLRRLLRNEDYWIKQIVLGESSVIEADYDEKQFPTAELIIDRMDETWRVIERFLEKTPVKELERLYVTPKGEQMTLLTILWILFMEELHTRSQVFLLLRLLGQAAPEI